MRNYVIALTSGLAAILDNLTKFIINKKTITRPETGQMPGINKVFANQRSSNWTVIVKTKIEEKIDK